MKKELHSFVKSVGLFIEKNNLMSLEKKYMVALSGGADSVALLLSLHMLGYHLEAVHCNFHLRGEESARDESFCLDLCKRMNIKLHVVHFDTREYASGHKMSIEMAARHLRYDYFERLIGDVGAHAVVVAHHKDDSVETVLINLIRGTGIHGLLGISPSRGSIIRPLLEVSKNEIVSFLNDIGQPFVTDSSNLIADVVRNKVRLSILPLMREINPSVEDSIMTTASRLRQVAGCFDELMKKQVADSFVGENRGVRYYDLDSIKEEYSLFLILRPLGFSPSAIQIVYDAMAVPSSGKCFYSNSHEVVFHRGQMLVRKIKKPFSPMKLPIVGLYDIPQNNKFSLKLLKRENVQIAKSPNMACFDAEKVKFPLTLRRIQKGDRFCPFGMKGSKLVSDFLTDLKKSLFDKVDQLVLVDEMDRVLWVVGKRMDNRFRITSNTQSVVLAEYEEKEDVNGKEGLSSHAFDNDINDYWSSY